MPRRYDVVLSELSAVTTNEGRWLASAVGRLMPPLPGWFRKAYPGHTVIRITSWDGRFIRFISREPTPKEREREKENEHGD